MPTANSSDSDTLSGTLIFSTSAANPTANRVIEWPIPHLSPTSAER